MDKNNNGIIIKEFNAITTPICVSSVNENVTAIGDEKGKIMLFDIRESKPIVKLINSGIKGEINTIVTREGNPDEILFSIGEEIYTVDIKNDKKIIGEKNINKIISSSQEENEISDFIFNPDHNIITIVDQEKEKFYFYKKKDNSTELIDTFSLSSAYGVTNTKTHSILYSFEGEIIQYDPLTKSTKSTKQIKNVFDSKAEADLSGNVSNPPYLNRIVYNSQTNLLICGLMNGLVIGLSGSNMKKKFIKTVHNGSVLDVKVGRFDKNSVITYGKDKCLKIGEIISGIYEIKSYVDMTCNIIDFDSNEKGEIIFIDNRGKNVSYLQYKN